MSDIMNVVENPVPDLSPENCTDPSSIQLLDINGSINVNAPGVRVYYWKKKIDGKTRSVTAVAHLDKQENILTVGFSVQRVTDNYKKKEGREHAARRAALPASPSNEGDKYLERSFKIVWSGDSKMDVIHIFNHELNREKLRSIKKMFLTPGNKHFHIFN